MEFELSRQINAEQDRDYAKALTECETLDDLRALVTAYAELAKDAVPVVERMTAGDFLTFREGLLKERKGQFAGAGWATKFAVILMPLPMLHITQIAAQFHAPFGVAWFRCKELRPDLLEVQV